MAENAVYVENYNIDIGLYTGQLLRGQPDGEGTLAYYSGTRYEGQWKMGKLHGLGQLRWTSGDSYRGDFVEGQRTGHGVYRFANGNLYRGDFLNGKFHGKGTFRRADGSRMQGRWKDHAYIADSGLSTQPVTGTEMEYWELYRWWCHYRGNSPAYNDRFRRLRACGNAQEVVRSILGGNDLSSVRGEEAEFCLFLLERFAPYDADRELLARCYYLNRQFAKAAGIAAMAICDSQIRQIRLYSPQALSPYEGLAMEILAAQYICRAIRICTEKTAVVVVDGTVLDWRYVMFRNLKMAQDHLTQTKHAAARYQPETLQQEIEGLCAQLDLR